MGPEELIATGPALAVGGLVCLARPLVFRSKLMFETLYSWHRLYERAVETAPRIAISFRTRYIPRRKENYNTPFTPRGNCRASCSRRRVGAVN